ncbi:MAG: leucine-rich repeat domain-containing protein [Paramuribaculum sp.]|nr:leucine-rich repeat domain-containing protein [Paramuribaculum sp.]
MAQNNSDYEKIEQNGIYYLLDETYANAHVCSKYDYTLNYDTYDYETIEPTYKGRVIIPETIEHNNKTYSVFGIWNHAFYKCTELEELYLPSSIGCIWQCALGKCGNIKLHTPNDLDIGAVHPNAFNGTVTENVSSISCQDFLLNEALSGSSFQKVLLGPSTILVETYVFRNSNIETVEMQWSSDETPLQLNVRAFGGFKGQEVRMPNREVAFSFEVFSDCPNLERVVFSPATSLRHVLDFQTISNTEGKFADANDLIYKCPNMKEVVSYATTPPQFYWYDRPYTNFCIIDKPDCVLKVPFGSEELYRADPVWGKFQIIEGFEPDEYTSIPSPYAITDNSDAPVEYFNLQGMKVTNPLQGNIYIRRQGTIVEKVIL